MLTTNEKWDDLVILSRAFLQILAKKAVFTIEQLSQSLFLMIRRNTLKADGITSLLADLKRKRATFLQESTRSGVSSDHWPWESVQMCYAR